MTWKRHVCLPQGPIETEEAQAEAVAGAVGEERKGEMREHHLKTIDLYFDAVESGEKTFEVRRNDRAFQTGDILVLERWVETSIGLTVSRPRRTIRKRITYLLQGGLLGIEPAFCVLGLGEASDQPPVEDIDR